MAFGIDDILATLATVGGGLGSIFGTTDPNQTQTTTVNRLTPEMQLALQRLKLLSEQGYGNDIVALMKNQSRTAIGNESSALKQSRTQLLQRQGAPTSIQGQQLNDLDMRRMQAIGSSLADIDIANEQAKMQALQAFAGLSDYRTTTTTTGAQNPGTGEGFGQLFGAGLNYFLNGTTGNGGSGSIYEDPAFQKLRTQGQRYQNYNIPSYQMNLPSGRF